MQEDNDQISQRKEKLSALRVSGNPFPNDFRPDAKKAGDLQAQYGEDEKEACCTENTIRRRHLTRGFKPYGVYGSPGCACPETKGEPDAISWGFLPAEQVESACRTRKVRSIGAGLTICPGQDLFDDLGSAVEACLCYRIEKCEKCGGNVKVIACIEDAEVIEKILKHLGLDEASQTRNRSPPEGLFQHSTQLF